MIIPVDSHGRSALLEFSRSPLLERNAPPPIADELSMTRTSNLIQGFQKFITRDWSWYPTYRWRMSFGSEFRETLATVGQMSLTGTMAITESQSAGWASVITGFALTDAVMTRADTHIDIQTTWTDGLGNVKNIPLAITVEGAPRDVRELAAIFWSACATATAPERPPLHTISTVLFEINQVANDNGTLTEISRGLRQPPPSQAFINSQIARSRMEVAINFTLAAGQNIWTLGDLLSPPHDITVSSSAGLSLEWIRHVRHFTTRGEAQFGGIDSPFSTIGTEFVESCQRGFTEEYESVIPPLLTATRLDGFPIDGSGLGNLGGSLATSIERRVIPPNAAHALLTC